MTQKQEKSKLEYLKKYDGIFSYKTKKGLRYGYRLPYYDSIHKRHEKQKRGFKDPRSAYRDMLAKQVDLADNETDLVAHDNMTVRQWANAYYEANKIRWKPSTCQRYRTAIDKHIGPFIGNVKLSELTKNRYQRELINPMVERGFKKWTIKGVHSMMMAFMNAAVDDGIINRNRLSHTPIPDTGHVEKRIMTKEELDQFNTQLDKEPITTQMLMYTLEETGMRQGELMGLKWEDIDLDKRELHINHTRDSLGLRAPKTEKSKRTVSISNHLVQLYRIWSIHQKEVLLRYGRKVTKDTFLMTSDFGNPLVNTAISQRLRTLLRHSGLGYLVGHFTAHTFRHMYASYLLNSGEDVSEVSAALGHSNPQMTLSVYTEKTPGKSDNLADKFNNLW